MNYPNFSSALNTLFKDAPSNAPQNSLQLAQAIGVSPSTITRHASGDKLPSADLLANIVEAFPEDQQPILIRAYMRDSLPAALRRRVYPEVGPERFQEQATDDITIICRALESFSPTHLSALRYLIERAATHPPILRALMSVVDGMRGE